MMLTLYNLLQAVLLPGLAPLGLAYFLSREKYRRILPGRLGAGLKTPSGKPPCFWIHALSVGEVNAAMPLIQKVRERWPESSLVCSSTTSTGLSALQKRAKGIADMIVSSPLDVHPVVRKFVLTIRPECFILVETDLWPNWLWQLRYSGTRNILVNGSISSKAAKRLRYFTPLAHLLYDPFDLLFLQSRDDLLRLIKLGVPEEKLSFAGNLKYDVSVPEVDAKKRMEMKEALGLDPGSQLWVAGSTHPGEEEPLLEVFRRIRPRFPGLQLLLAPRDPKRGLDVSSLAREKGFKVRRRTQGPGEGRLDVLVLDTLGELVRCYALADLAFVGGSLVKIGGHNLLEPAAYGVPVLHGPFVESCREMAQGLSELSGGIMVGSSQELYQALHDLLSDPDRRQRMSKAARRLVENNKGAVSRHIELIAEILKDKTQSG